MTVVLWMWFIVDNPISGEGLGHIVASKYWESFSVISTPNHPV